ncbi:MAG: hypothetical protein DA408_17680 [Bacteroidetes bacterium]|nr:MAG: hypothetical protein C7N36_04910 [Bacteroidota bacterium]PTM09693.1 MAG: hypothetical protein DA408_17680 [Bacteroidota bacterium]
MTKLIPAAALLIGLLGACSSNAPETTKKNAATDTFFSLANFFDQEATRLDSLQPRLRKHVRMNEEEEEKILENVDFGAELALFRGYDINRKSWVDKYQADSVYLNGNLQRIDYQAREPDLTTQELHIEFDPTGKVAAITIVGQSATFLASNNNWLHYTTNQGYTIKTEQKNRAAETVNILIEGEFMAPE